MPNKIKAYELQSKLVVALFWGGDYSVFNEISRSKNDLSKLLTELKQELSSLRVQKIAGGSAAKLTKMWGVVDAFIIHTRIDLFSAI